MKAAATLWMAFNAPIVGAHTSTGFESYDAFYATQSGAIFNKPIQADADAAYYVSGETGIRTEIQSTLQGRPVDIVVAGDRMLVNGRTYRYSHATNFPGEYPTDVDPPTAEVFLASRTSTHPDALCIQGSSDGSGEADRYSQIYLLIDPLAPRSKAAFLHLPSLLSSCRAVLNSKKGDLSFPKNSYLFDDAKNSRIGLLMTYYTFHLGQFMPTNHKIHIHFAQPEIPFQFSTQDESR